jgi:hypothetical protein
MYMKATTLTENYKAAYELWRERKSRSEEKYRLKITVKAKKLYLKE